MNIIFKILRYLKKYRFTLSMVISLIVIISIFNSSSHYKSYYEKEVKKNELLSIEVNNLLNENDILKQKVEELEEELSTHNNTTQQELDKASPCYEATLVWNNLKSLRLNDYVCAGIIGNIMAEVGGQTLDFSYWEIGSQSTHYGICQWGGARRERLLTQFGGSLEAQIEFLKVELFEVIPQTSSFYQMQNEKEAALYFAKYYERCSSDYYAIRQINATKALDYFTKNNVK